MQDENLVQQYNKQGYDPCLQHGASLRLPHSYSTGSPACRGKAPGPPWSALSRLQTCVNVHPKCYVQNLKAVLSKHILAEFILAFITIIIFILILIFLQLSYSSC